MHQKLLGFVPGRFESKHCQAGLRVAAYLNFIYARYLIVLLQVNSEGIVQIRPKNSICLAKHSQFGRAHPPSISICLTSWQRYLVMNVVIGRRSATKCARNIVRLHSVRTFNLTTLLECRPQVSTAKDVHT